LATSVESEKGKLRRYDGRSSCVGFFHGGTASGRLSLPSLDVIAIEVVKAVFESVFTDSFSFI